MLGQIGIAEGHLNKQAVATGDIFLFFGFYRRVEETAQGWRFVRGARELHVLWGWLQVDQKYRVADIGPTDLPWTQHHPHLSGGHRGDQNTVYDASTKLDLGSADRCEIAGWGEFPKFDRRLLLTDRTGAGVSQCRLPRRFYPDGNKPRLTYRPDRRHWRHDANHAYLRSVGRGQEFVLDLDHYREATPWSFDLVNSPNSYTRD